MSRQKTKTVSFRLTPDVREMIERVAESERRSLSNLFEVMAIEYCSKRGIHPQGEITKGETK